MCLKGSCFVLLNKSMLKIISQKWIILGQTPSHILIFINIIKYSDRKGENEWVSFVLVESLLMLARKRIMLNLQASVER